MVIFLNSIEVMEHQTTWACTQLRNLLLDKFTSLVTHHHKTVVTIKGQHVRV